MPAQSRAERRRANTRQQPQSATSAKPRIYTDAPVLPEITLDPPQTVAANRAGPGIASDTFSSSSKVARRLRTRAAPEPIDYSKDLRDTRRDLRLIIIWALLMFTAMVALYVARSNGLF